MQDLLIELSYDGSSADAHHLDFYDAAVALMGFQRSLALTTHLVLNNEVITQAPALKGARIFAEPPAEGSWKILASVGSIGAAAFALGTADKDTPIGNLVSSAYDFVISKTLGFHVDYDKTLGQQYEEMRQKNPEIKKLDESRFDSVIEKCETAVRDMHRPIISSRTAIEASLTRVDSSKPINIGEKFNYQSYNYMMEIKPRATNGYFQGRVSSYNINTYSGRIFIPSEKRPIPFEIADDARNPRLIALIIQSMSANSKTEELDVGLTGFSGIALESRTGILKKIIIDGVDEV